MSQPDPGGAGRASVGGPVASTPREGYRPHLDGIRALAVVMVVAFHLGYDWIPGGFVGVDVFFVLSGFLITGILVDEATSTGAVRLGRFFSRRVRRLIPASIAVLVMVVLAGRRWFDAVQFHDLGIDAVWSALYSANWRFATKGGDYFAPGEVPSPLVHYWSLAVEEQFYLCWPFVVAGVAWVARRRGWSVAGVLALVAGAAGVASAVASVTTAGTPLAYYGTHTRAYQLLAGAGLACLVRRYAVLDRSAHLGAPGLRRHLGPAAVAVALTSLFWLGHRTESAAGYPGWPAVLVTVASVVLIAALDLTPRGPHQRLMGAWPLAALGRWSYSVYIWHWPVIVFAPIVAEQWDRTWIAQQTTMLLAIGALAGVSYLALERPIRFHLVPGASARAVVPIGLTCSLLVAVSVASISTIQPHEQAAYDATLDLAAPGRCPYGGEAWPAADDAEPCLWRDGSGPTVALVGDSHAQQWLPAFEAMARRDDLRLVRVTRTSCPAPDVTVYNRAENGREEDDPECTAWRRAVYPRLVDMYDPDVIFVSTRGHVTGIVDGGRRIRTREPEHLELWTEGWDWTLDTLSAGRGQVVVATILPTMPERVPACLMDHPAGTDRCDFPAHVDERVGAYNDVIRSLPEGRPAVGVVDLLPLVCPDASCPAILDDIVVHRDNNHITAAFARSRTDELSAALDLVLAVDDA